MHHKFLEQIADYYTDTRRIEQLPHTTFIFPNKRAGTFLAHYIKQRISGPYSLMPRFSTFQRFALNFANSKDASRFELLFLLYKIYVEVEAEHSPEAAENNRFDKFIFWGDMILDDFDLIDSSLADADKIYDNLKNFKEIATDYLTDEQKRVIERIWGPSRLGSSDDVIDFWKHIHRERSGKEEKKDLIKDFVAHWEILGEVYRRFRAHLEKEDISTAGMQLRRACQIIKDTPVAKLARRKYVFVGHADLSYAEIAIMNRLKSAGCADFFWDLESPLFKHGKFADETNTAIRFINRLAREFPMPDDFNLEKVDGIPQIDIIGVASSSIQAKMVGKIITEMNPDAQEAFDTAIVVPDPSQLMSLMLSLPRLTEKDEQGDEKEIGVNITLGLPYSTTTFATLFSAVFSMQRNSHLSADKTRYFFYKDVTEILLHPHIQLIAPNEANLIRQYIADNNLFNIKSQTLIEHLPRLRFLFTPINNNRGERYLGDTVSSAQYIRNLIAGLRESLSSKPGFSDSFELKMLDYFEEQTVTLESLIEKYQIDMHDTTFLMLFERIMMSKTISMEGTPVKGLQIMGVLETRCLDFDNIIFLSMNENSLPRREYVRTMIPNNLRRGYGLPSIEHTESFYSYYFFRAISRSSRATLLYDTRPPGKGRGEISRYLEQLLYIFNDGHISHKIINLTGSLPEKRTITVHKNKKVMERIQVFKNPDSGRSLSASSLKKYLDCPLKFYLMVVNGLGDEDEPTEYLTAAKVGDLFHNSAQIIFDTFKNKLITEDVINEILRSDIIENTVSRQVAMLARSNEDDPATSNARPEGLLVGNSTKAMLREMFEAEKKNIEKNGPFTYIDGEYEVLSRWKVNDHEFNFHMKIDRIDRIDESTLRFIDYKTGKDENEAKKGLEEVFSGDYRKAAIFQLLTYAAAYRALHNDDSDIAFSLYITRNLMSGKSIEPIKIGNKTLTSFNEISNEFNEKFSALIDGIFNETTPFVQCDDIKRCKYCPFTTICGRTIPADFKKRRRS